MKRMVCYFAQCALSIFLYETESECNYLIASGNLAHVGFSRCAMPKAKLSTAKLAVYQQISKQFLKSGAKLCNRNATYLRSKDVV